MESHTPRGILQLHDWMHDREGPGFIAVFNHAKAFMPQFETAVLLHLKDDSSNDVGHL